jgi:cyclomaltodextrinase
MVMPVPSWVQDAVFYQIFPDRFFNGDLSNDPVNVQPWGSKPTTWNFMGGDLRGIINKIDYLLDLGVSAIYLNPIFQSASNHRYNISDYFRIDPKLGSMEDFKDLIETAHTNNLWVILDGVFNHCGRGFFAFNDLLENQKYSPYMDWFHVNKYPIHAYGAGKSEEYDSWGGYRSLPKFNTNNPAVRRYIMEVAQYWIKQGADGWRLDVPNEIDDDDFWSEFRDTVKTINGDSLIIGEIWDANSRWVGENHFDGLMNYPVREALLGLIDKVPLTISDFTFKIEELFKIYPRENMYSMYVPLGSHDTERLLTLLDGNIEKAKLCYAFQFAFPGSPAIYYGDEIGMKGGKDPGCRGSFPWDGDLWNWELRDWIKKLIRVRKGRKALRQGDFDPIKIEANKQVFAFTRTFQEESVLVLINPTAKDQQVEINIEGFSYQSSNLDQGLLGIESFRLSEDTLSIDLPEWGAAWIGLDYPT